MISKEDRIDECERSLIGGMIVDNSIIPNVLNVVKSGVFQNTLNQSIVDKLQELNAKGIVADLVTICNELPAVDPGYIAELTNNACSPSTWSYFANEIRDAYIMRGMVSIARETEIQVKQLAVKPKKDAGEVQGFVSDFQKRISNLLSNTTGCSTYVLKDLIVKEVSVLESYMNNKKVYLGYPTGFEGIDRILNGLQPVYMVIGARPSMGKTALAQKMAYNLSQSQRVLFIELEMSPRQLVERQISNLSGIPFQKIQSGMVTKAALNRIIAQMDAIGQNSNFIPAECPTRQLSDILNLCRAEVRNKGTKIIFIDHIGLIKTADLAMPAWERSRFISNELQLLQRELNVPIVVLSQLGRDAEDAKKTSLANFRGSGAIEEDADVCAFIERARAESENDLQIETNFSIRKNRNGPVGNARLMFFPATVNFRDYDNNTQKEIEKAKNINPEKSKKEFYSQNKSNPESGFDWVPQQAELDYDDEVPF